MSVGLAVSLTVQAIAVLLFVTGMATFVTLVKGSFLLRRMARMGRRDYSEILLKSPMAPAISTIAAPPDASPESRRFARRLLDLHFGRNEVVIVLDGPSETDLETWKREFHLCASTRTVEPGIPTKAVHGVYESREPIRVVFVDKERGGAADAFNVGVNAATSPVIGLLEPDSDFTPAVLLKMIQPMLEAPEETVAVCGGTPAPPAQGMAAQFGALESLRAWLTRGAAFAARNLVLPFPGSAILARRDAVVKAGGFTGTRLELVLRLHAIALAGRKPYRIAFLPEAVSHSRVPLTFMDLRLMLRQDESDIARAFRRRTSLVGPFARSALRSLYYTRSARPKLEMAAYVLTVVGLVAGWVDVSLALLVFLSTAVIGMVLSMAAVVLREVAEPNSTDERRMAALFFAAIPENLGYRQVRDLWLIAGFRKSATKTENRGKTVPDHPAAAPDSSKKS